MGKKKKLEKENKLRRREVKIDGKSQICSPEWAIDLALSKAFRNLYKAVQKNVIKPAVALALAEERERMRSYLEKAIEVLSNAQGEWAAAAETHAPRDLQPLKEAVSLVEKALAGNKRKATEEKALTIAGVSFAYDNTGKISGVVFKNYGEEGVYFVYQFKPDEYEEVNHED